MKRVLAFDFGASSGRAILADYQAGQLHYREIHRFENCPVERDGHLCWDFDTLLREIREGIAKAGEFDSLGFDTWGVDFGLLDAEGRLIGFPVHYRDRRTEGCVETVLETFSAEELYARTGNQILAINTLFQLVAIKRQEPKLLEQAERLLFMPDLFGWALCGKMACEQSIASTSQLLDPASGKWAAEVLEQFGISQEIFAPLVSSGSVLGEFQGRKIISVAGHDTQCAVAALPSNDPNRAFLSCGTWSLLGCELEAPLLTDPSLSNEWGANGRFNYLKNIIGLWLIQESRREWRRQGQEYSYAELERLALEAEPFHCFIDPDAPEFAPPGDIPGRIQEFCRRMGQPVPETVGSIVRCIYESLAMKYRFALRQLGQSAGRHFSVLHILGGGAKDGLLCQMAADACGIPVEAGPVEATALGNILIQLCALEELSDIAAGRELLARTELLRRFEPKDLPEWDQAYSRYTQIQLDRKGEQA